MFNGETGNVESFLDKLRLFKRMTIEPRETQQIYEKIAMEEYKSLEDAYSNSYNNNSSRKKRITSVRNFRNSRNTSTNIPPNFIHRNNNNMPNNFNNNGINNPYNINNNYLNNRNNNNYKINNNQILNND
ncbi:hypothetical protein H8356DRAFT_1341393 [Neocallimastix lanati (nom. inval.)]|nr:hypothetical protein H8356DRAFT_1341393 [Neocallimastix sp. JGI-2020a]